MPTVEHRTVDGDADVAEVTAMSDAYEAALLRNDIEAMNAVFWHDPNVLRFGLGDMQRGYEQIVAWRATARPVNPGRVIVSRDVTALASGVVAVDIVFDDGDQSLVGRQSQTWVRRDDGWKIARAHVSLIRR
jgi:ketosteroid isomerase-like protein